MNPETPTETWVKQNVDEETLHLFHERSGMNMSDGVERDYADRLAYNEMFLKGKLK